MSAKHGREAVCLTLDMPDPGDASALAAAIADGRLPREGLRAVLVKTPGNGLTNDFSRDLALRSIAAALGPGPAPMLLASGGTEGVAVPHMIALGEAPSRRRARAKAPWRSDSARARRCRRAAMAACRWRAPRPRRCRPR